MLALDELMFDRAKQWTLVSHFVVPGMGGTQMKDRADLIDAVRQASSRHGVAMFDPSIILERHGRETVLASEGRDVYHYNPNFHETVADGLLAAAGLVSGPVMTASAAAAKIATPSAAGATERVNDKLLQLHLGRVAALGVDESGLYAHYKGLLDSERIAGQSVAELANLITYLLPRFDRYDVLRAGLGELAFVLAALGLRAVGFDQNPKRFAAMTAGLEEFTNEDLEIASRLTIGRAAIPDLPRRNRVLGIATHLIGYTPEQQEQAINKLSAYSALLIDPRVFLYLRNSDEEREAIVETLRSLGFTQIREFPKLSVVYCAKPDILSTENIQETTPAAVENPTVIAKALPPKSEQSVAAVAELAALDGAATAAAAVAAVAPAPEAGIWTLTAPFESNGGGAWVRSLPAELHSKTDNNDEPYQSLLRLFEDNQELGPGHARHETIRERADGHYSFWSEMLYFSTTDGSDPNLNGRSYTVALVG